MRWNAGSHWNARILGASVRQKSLPCLCIATIVIITITIVIITIIIIIAVAIFTQDRTFCGASSHVCADASAQDFDRTTGAEEPIGCPAEEEEESSHADGGGGGGEAPAEDPTDKAGMTMFRD